jgi:hypothetical protein
LMLIPTQKVFLLKRLGAILPGGGQRVYHCHWYSHLLHLSFRRVRYIMHACDAICCKVCFGHF